jgi:three-Cys-motif partner protein
LGEETVDLAGSVLRALDVDLPFKRLVFIEENRDRFHCLEEIAAANPKRNITPLRGDANARLREIFGAPPWSRQHSGRGSHRAIVFLDPFGMSVKWQTLKDLAETRAVDVWYLFPTGAVNRQLAGDLARVDEDKQRALDEVFGSTAWHADIYKSKTVHGGLFDEVFTTASKTFTVDQIEQYARDRLATIFGYVSDPLTLLNDRASKIFSLFLLSNSLSPQALALIKKGVKSVQKKFGGR